LWVVLLLLIKLVLLIRHLAEYHGALVSESLCQPVYTGSTLPKFLQKHNDRLDSTAHRLFFGVPRGWLRFT
jgi:hypothetical protein